MTTSGLIGAGNIGSTVAKLAVDAGYDVVLSNSRGPETLAEQVGQLGPRARAATAAEAATAGDLVVVTVPLKAYRDLPAEELTGKVVIDTNNYYPERDGRIAALDSAQTTTSQLVQDHLAGSLVVKAFNNIFFRALASLSRTAGTPDRTTLPVFGNDPGAKKQVITFLDALGYDGLDGGPLTESWRSENGQPVYVHPYATGDAVDQPQSADRETVAGLLGRAERGAGSPA